MLCILPLTNGKVKRTLCESGLFKAFMARIFGVVTTFRRPESVARRYGTSHKCTVSSRTTNPQPGGRGRGQGAEDRRLGAGGWAGNRMISQFSP